MRVIQKYAVRIGGGKNHRFNLSDEYLIKDNHVASSNLKSLVELAIKNKKGRKITKPVTFLGIPMLMVRNAAGEIKVFQNVCRHRGMILVEKPVKLRGPITCPYHAWSYDLDGKLRRTPHVGGPDIDSHDSVKTCDLPLIRVRSHLWRDVIFVNVGVEAPPFEDAAAALIERWREFEQPLVHTGADSSISFTLDCNWKLAVENYCEAYHLPFVHPALNSYSHLEDHYNILDADGYAGQGTTKL